MRYVLAEFLGTTILILLGNAAVTQNYLATGTSLQGSFFNVIVAWGLALTVASVVTMPVTAAHLNPATTLMFTFFRSFPRRRVLPTIVAQLLGGLAASFLLVSLYPSIPKTAEARFCFATYPQSHVSILVAFWNEVLATGVLHIIVMAVSDPRHKVAPLAASAILGGALITVGLTMGFQTGYALNPARDFGPRLVSYLRKQNAFSFTFPHRSEIQAGLLILLSCRYSWMGRWHVQSSSVCVGANSWPHARRCHGRRRVQCHARQRPGRSARGGHRSKIEPRHGLRVASKHYPLQSKKAPVQPGSTFYHVSHIRHHPNTYIYTFLLFTVIIFLFESS